MRQDLEFVRSQLIVLNEQDQTIMSKGTSSAFDLVSTRLAFLESNVGNAQAAAAAPEVNQFQTIKLEANQNDGPIQ